MKKTNGTATTRTRVTPAPAADTLTREQFQYEQTRGILGDLHAAPRKRVTHTYGDESATSTFDAFGRVSRVKSAGYDAAAREHAESRKVGALLVQGVHKALNGKRVAPAQARMVTPDLLDAVRAALGGAQPTLAAVCEALRAVAASS